jgi:hypothetical protein
VQALKTEIENIDETIAYDLIDELNSLLSIKIHSNSEHLCLVLNNLNNYNNYNNVNSDYNNIKNNVSKEKNITNIANYINNNNTNSRNNNNTKNFHLATLNEYFNDVVVATANSETCRIVKKRVKIDAQFVTVEVHEAKNLASIDSLNYRFYFVLYLFYFVF